MSQTGEKKKVFEWKSRSLILWLYDFFFYDHQNLGNLFLKRDLNFHILWESKTLKTTSILQGPLSDFSHTH